jgi:outer membrane murein-binding lipoprotein Lpp
MRRKETAVKKIVVLVVLAALVLAGCASGKFLGFLATTDYVDNQAKTLVQQQAAQIEQLKTQIAANQGIVDQAKAAIERVAKIEDQINSIPEDVIRQIADILRAALK